MTVPEVVLVGWVGLVAVGALADGLRALWRKARG